MKRLLSYSLFSCLLIVFVGELNGSDRKRPRSLQEQCVNVIVDNPAARADAVEKLPLALLEGPYDKRGMPEGPWAKFVNKGLMMRLGHTKVMGDRQESISSVAWHPDGSKVVSGSCDGSVKIWDAETGSLLQRLAQGNVWIDSVAVSSDGKVVSGGSSRAVMLWSVETGALLQTWDGRSCSSVAFSPNSDMVAAGLSRNVKIWIAETGALWRTFEESYASVAWNHDGSKLVTVGLERRTAKIWNVETGELEQAIGARESITVAWHPYDNKLALGSSDGLVKIWDAEGGTLLQTLGSRDRFITSVAWNSDGSKIASGSIDGFVRIWNAETGELLQAVQDLNCCSASGIREIAWHPDGSKLLWSEKGPGFGAGAAKILTLDYRNKLLKLSQTGSMQQFLYRAALAWHKGQRYETTVEDECYQEFTRIVPGQLLFKRKSNIAIEQRELSVCSIL